MEVIVGSVALPVVSRDEMPTNTGRTSAWYTYIPEAVAVVRISK
jgi:hypothetical protein